MVMAIDFGGSSTKVIGAGGESARKALVMEPDAIELPRELVEEPGFGKVAIEDRAWVTVNGKYHAVGEHARALSRANPRLNSPKVETGVCKTLAATWALARYGRLPSSSRLRLCCVLPPGEYEDRERFRVKLESALSSFETPTGRLNVTLEEFNCKPEGAGVYMNHARLRGKELSGEVSTVMLGYRNASVMNFRKGKLNSSATSRLGFSRLLDGVVSRTSGYGREEIAPGVARYLETGREEYLKVILLSDEPDAELERLKEAIALAGKKYERELSDWLKENVSRGSGEVLACGGTADYLKKSLYERFEGKELYLHGGVELPPDIAALGMGNRFADIWIMWDYFSRGSGSGAPRKSV